jgi:uncharacterized protein YciI
MTTFAVTLVHGPSWDASCAIREQQCWEQHAAFMDSLVDDQFIILGGPLSDGDRSLHLVAATDEAQIRARLGEDPWAAMGLLTIGSIEPWALWLDSRASPPTPGTGPRHHRPRALTYHPPADARDRPRCTIQSQSPASPPNRRVTRSSSAIRAPPPSRRAAGHG